MPSLLFAVLLWLSSASVAAVEPPRVVATIAPLHALAAGVMEGVGEPALLLAGAQPLHGQHLKPSQMALLREAGLVLWVGPSLERFMVRPLAALEGEREVMEVERLPGVVRLPLREGGAWGEHPHHGHGDHDGTAQAIDGHLWLDPRNARIIVAALAERLARLDPGRAEHYRANRVRLDARIERLDHELRRRLAAIGEVPYLVFHDAFHYFEARYGLSAAGALTQAPDRRPGARRLRELRRLARERGIRCLFREPQYPSVLADSLAHDAGLKVELLDPLGSTLAPGPELYFELMEGIARSLRRCLSAPSR